MYGSDPAASICAHSLLADAPCTSGVSNNISSDVTALSALSLAFGNAFSCSLSLNGSVRCQGDNSYCQLGVSPASRLYDNPKSYAFVASPFIPAPVVQITAGSEHACALTNSSLYCWGSSDFAQTGSLQRDGTCTPTVVPVRTL